MQDYLSFVRAQHFLKLFNEFESNTQKKAITMEQFSKTLEKKYAMLCGMSLFSNCPNNNNVNNTNNINSVNNNVNIYERIAELPKNNNFPVSFFSPSFEKVINLMIGIRML